MAVNKLLIILLVSFFQSFRLFACMNEFEVIPGISRIETSAYELYKPHVNSSSLRTFTAKKAVLCGLNKTCNDLVIAYLYLREFDKALKLSSKLIHRFPSVYEIVMTHAAALELNGKPQEALKYIKQGIKIYPDSHFGSEWIHVKILEDQISGEHKNIIGLDFGNGPQPVAPEGLKPIKTLVELHYQLKERYYFISGKDAQFASLLHDYADLLYLNNYKTISQEYYRLAYDYGYKGSPRKKYINPNKRKEHADSEMSLQREESLYSKQRENDLLAVLTSLGGMLLLVAAAQVFRKG